MRLLSKAVLAGLAVAVLASTASAQRAVRTSSSASTAQGGYWEFGGDMGIMIGLDDPKSLSIQIPVSAISSSPAVRAGYYVSDVLSIEPGFSFLSSATKGQTAFSVWTLSLAALYHLSPDRNVNRLFVHPFLSFTGGSGGRDTQTGLGAGIGMMRPAFGTNRFQWRLEAGLQHLLKAGFIPASTGIYGTWGISIFTK